MGQLHLQRLRLCSRSWRSICNAEAISFRCGSHTLTAAVSFASSLPRLRKLTIKRSKDESCTITGSVLSSVEAKKLEVLTFEGFQNLKATKYKMAVEDCSRLLLPWSQSLQCLHLVRCLLLSGVGGDTFAGPAFFSNFPQLKVLKLEGVRAEPPLTSLDLQGCKKLSNLDCYHGQLSSLHLYGCKQLTTLSLSRNRLSSLDLSDCVELTRLRCDFNQLGALDLSGCAKLTHVACNSNRLFEMDLTSCAHLRELQCSHNKQLESLRLCDTAALLEVTVDDSAEGVMVSGNASIHTLYCDSGSVNLIPPKMCAQLVDLYILDEVLSEVAGCFNELDFLACRIGPTGLVDLTGCTSGSLFLIIHTSPNGLMLNGRSAVTHLTLLGQVYHLDLQGFMSLQVLNISAINYNDMSLDLSVCPSIINLTINEEGKPGSYEVCKINLQGCSSLEVLDLRYLSYLDVLDLSSCVALTDVTCVGTDLQQLDVSCCHFLTSLDICCSKLLNFVSVPGSITREKIDHDDNPQLVICYE